MRHWRGPRRKLSPEEIEANAKARAARAAAVKHCQICERAILANTGLIAHHGYKRPGRGWQTSSCFGARYRPYEVACDALQPAIESLWAYIERVEVDLARWIAKPPRGIEAKARPTQMHYRPHSYLRPADFDPSHPPRGGYGFRDEYTRLYWSKRAEMETDIRHAGLDLDRLRKRLADWKPAKEV